MLSSVPDKSHQQERTTSDSEAVRNGMESGDDPGQETVKEGAEEGSVQDQINLVPEIMSRAPDQPHQQEKPTTSDAALRNGMQGGDGDGPAHGTVDQGADQESIKDQLILAPEIMNKILEFLDLRSLKTVRLVCKSWLLQAQAYVERRGIVRLGDDYRRTTRIQEFIEIRKNKLPALTQPFLSLDVDLDGMRQRAPHELALRQLSTLCPPLVITRFSTDCMPLALAVSLLIQCSSNLEHLTLFGRDSDEEEYRRVEQNHPNVNFPKLRRLGVLTFGTRKWNGFPRLLRWIMRASPNVEALEAWTDGSSSKKLGNGVLLVAELGKMTTLKLGGFTMGTAILKHFSSIPFSTLQHLKMQFITGEAGHEVLLDIVTKAGPTLRTLELLDGQWDAGSEFPVCLNVEELHLKMCPGWSGFVSRRFPSLKHFCAVMPMGDKGFFPGSPALVDVKTFSFPGSHEHRPSSSFGPIELFTTFPALERLRIHESYLLEYHRLKNRGDPGFVDLLAGLRHLEVEGSLQNWSSAARDAGYGLFAELKGLESLEVEKVPLSQIIKIPVEAMPSIKVLRFSWESRPNLDLKKLLEILRGVGKVEIANCCAFLKDGSWPSKDPLVQFFEAAPNAGCGCKKT